MSPSWLQRCSSRVTRHPPHNVLGEIRNADPAVRRRFALILVVPLEQSHDTWTFSLCGDVPRPDAVRIQRRQMLRCSTPHSLANRSVDTVHAWRAFALQPVDTSINFRDIQGRGITREQSPQLVTSWPFTRRLPSSVRLLRPRHVL